jgi:hypothetical protein
MILVTLVAGVRAHPGLKIITLPAPDRESAKPAITHVPATPPIWDRLARGEAVRRPLGPVAAGQPVGADVDEHALGTDAQRIAADPDARRDADGRRNGLGMQRVVAGGRSAAAGLQTTALLTIA